MNTFHEEGAKKFEQFQHRPNQSRFERDSTRSWYAQQTGCILCPPNIFAQLEQRTFPRLDYAGGHFLSDSKPIINDSSVGAQGSPKKTVRALSFVRIRIVLKLHRTSCGPNFRAPRDGSELPAVSAEFSSEFSSELD